jgi:hypothetical protein
MTSRVGVPALSVVVAVLLVGCSTSPTTTYTAPGGKEVTVDWADYPGHAYTDSDEVLAAPIAEDVEQESETLLTEIEAALTQEFGLEWEDGPDSEPPFWHQQDGNGYGGESLYITYNSPTSESTTVPSGDTAWKRAIEIASAVTEAHGLGKLRLENLDPDMAEQYGSADVSDHWQWATSTYRNAQWVGVTLSDVDRDPTGKAEKEMAGSVEYGWNPRSINIYYGVTTIRAADRAEFIERLKPFEGLARPEATTSD